MEGKGREDGRQADRIPGGPGVRHVGGNAALLRKLGLTGSVRKTGYACRANRPEDFRRLQSILALRKLRLPLKKIGGSWLIPALPPQKRKHFAGGIYAAHMIQMGNLEEWVWLDEKQR